MRNLKDKIKGAPNFTYGELIHSDSAERLGIDNTPTSEAEWESLEQLAINILQPLRDKFGAIKINSCYRSRALNKAIGGSETSNHSLARAADIEAVDPNVSNMELLTYIYDNLPFYELIAEKLDKNDPRAGWVHVAYNGTRRESGLKILRNGKGEKVEKIAFNDLMEFYNA